MLTRRKVLYGMAGGSALGGVNAGPALAQGLGTDFDVVVIGAGVAGLATAERLLALDAELKVLVLEARDRIGGRIDSAKRDGFDRDAELGAMYLDAGLGTDWPLAKRLSIPMESLPSGDLVFYPGMAALVRGLAASSNGQIQLSSEVTDIFWRQGLVGVKYRNRGLDGAVTARRLVLTLPAAVLRDSPPAMTPALTPAKMQALRSMSVDGAITAALQFEGDTAVLRDGQTSWQREDAGLRLRASTSALTGALLLEAQFSGARADALQGQPEELLLTLALREFADALSTLPAAADASWSALTNWNAERFSRGALALPGSAAAHRTLASAMQETVFFAGEATADPGMIGTVHGAYSSGERAAREVALSLDLELLDDPNEPLFELL